MMAEYKQNVAMQGMDFNQYMAMLGTDENGFRSIMRSTAERQTKTEILLQAVAEAEGIEAAEEEIEEEYKKAAENYQVEIERVKAAIAADLIARDIRFKKASDIVCDSAVATDVKPEEPKAEEPAAEEKPKAKRTRSKTKKTEEKPQEENTEAAEKPAE
jgi:trigger factor